MWRRALVLIYTLVAQSKAEPTLETEESDKLHSNSKIRASPGCCQHISARKPRRDWVSGLLRRTNIDRALLPAMRRREQTMSCGKRALAATRASTDRGALLGGLVSTRKRTLCRRVVAMPPRLADLDEIPDERSNSISLRIQFLFHLSQTR